MGVAIKRHLCNTNGGVEEGFPGQLRRSLAGKGGVMFPLGLGLLLVEQRQAELIKSAERTRIARGPRHAQRNPAMLSWLMWGDR